MFIIPNVVPVFMITLATTYSGNDNVKMEESAFSDYAWVNNTNLDIYECICGIKDEARTSLDLFC
jgi:hypothetical protein